MIDEERQAPFRGQYKQFAISLRISAEDTLSIAVENTQTLERYNRSIDREYILQQTNFFQGGFEGGKDVYDFLKVSFSKILIEGEFLLFDMEYGNKKIKRISIKLLREAIDPIEFAHLKAEKMKEKFTAQLLQKDIEIAELKQKYEDIVQRHSAEIQQLRGELQQKYEDITLYSAEIQKLRGELKAEKNRGELEIEKKKNREFAENHAYLIPLIPVLSDLKKMLYSKEVKIFSNIDHHPNNSHKVHYVLTNMTGTSARITRIGENKYYNFVNQCEILPNQKTRHSLTINKTIYGQILIGFCTEMGLGNIDNWKHAESAYYYCQRAGYLWQGGSGKQVGVCTVAEETVECVADLASFKLSWWKKGSQIAECAVPTGMRNKPIYISIILFDSGDEVDLYV